MQPVQVLEDVEVTFLSAELQCPLCDFYDVEEDNNSYSCFRCGTNWKVLISED